MYIFTRTRRSISFITEFNILIKVLLKLTYTSKNFVNSLHTSSSRVIYTFFREIIINGLDNYFSK